MREAPKGIALLVAAVFLLSVLAPELDYVQGRQDAAGLPTFVEGATSFALCSGFTVVFQSQHWIGRLLLPEQIWCTCPPFIPTSPSRAPPSFVSTAS